MHMVLRQLPGHSGWSCVCLCLRGSSRPIHLTHVCVPASALPWFDIPSPQTWADTFISELNDTHIEADLRLRHTPPELDIPEVNGQTAAGEGGVLVLVVVAAVVKAGGGVRLTGMACIGQVVQKGGGPF